RKIRHRDRTQEWQRPLFQASLVAERSRLLRIHSASRNPGTSCTAGRDCALRALSQGGGYDRPARFAGPAGMTKQRPLFQASLVASCAIPAPAARGPIGGEGGIRTPVTLSGKHTFQACALNHSATSPFVRIRGCGPRMSHARGLTEARAPRQAACACAGPVLLLPRPAPAGTSIW